jgi:hypothetical protein
MKKNLLRILLAVLPLARIVGHFLDKLILGGASMRKELQLARKITLLRKNKDFPVS